MQKDILPVMDSDTGKFVYMAIDLKSFYSSVECVARRLDPLTTHLVVADVSRTEKTICLAISPSLKAYGLGGRARLFEVVEKMRQVNAERSRRIGYRPFTGKSYSSVELARHPDWEAAYIVATPRMAEYIRVSRRINDIYLKYMAPEDIHVYSIDEIFADVTGYLRFYGGTAREFATAIIRDVFSTTGITATCGIGSNIYLCKVAMDVLAKHLQPDDNGVRIAELDEMSYRRQLWGHRPLTDFWRLGRATAARLEALGVETMGQLARFSLTHEARLYKLFGVNAELLVDHAWGYEPVTMAAIKAYRPATHSLGTGQVLSCPYSFDKARVVAEEMADTLALRMVARQVVGRQVVLTVDYDRTSLAGAGGAYQGELSTDRYGRLVPKHARGSLNLARLTSSSRAIMEAVARLFDRIVNPLLTVRRVNVTICGVVPEQQGEQERRREPVQLDLFTDFREEQARREKEEKDLAKERSLQQASIRIKRKFGKNALLRGLNFADGSTQRERNLQIGGHKA